VNGVDGLPGADGKNGVDGLPGADGTNGVDGLPGADGTNGVDGLPGADGTNGVDGLPGADGVNGVDGLPGADGTNGVDGLPGADGTDGADGAEGPQGPKGDPGLSDVSVQDEIVTSVNSVDTVLTVPCPATQVAIGGGHKVVANPGVAPAILASHPVSGQGVFSWSVTAEASTQSYTLEVFVVCANVPVLPV
jgi:hypothetical protein